MEVQDSVNCLGRREGQSIASALFDDPRGIRVVLPSHQDQIAFLHCLDAYHQSSDSGERQYKSRT